MKKNRLLFEGSEWDFHKLEETWKVIEEIGLNQLGFDVYPSQIEIISSEQMIDNYSNHALPTMYNHWSFGKSFLENQKSYQSGQSGLAYEVVINTNPCIAYLMENNTMTLQALVMAHANIGHNSFFKTNYLFTGWTDADSILDYLKYAKNYIAGCEQKHGQQRVEAILDACHSLQLYGVDKYKKPKNSEKIRNQKDKEISDHEESSFNDLWRTVPNQEQKLSKKEIESITLPEENILYFIEKYSPVLKTWEKEIVRIVRKLAQYFYPQRQTQLINEAFASFTHHTIMNMMFDQGYINSGSVIEFLKSHAGVVAQPSWNSKYFSGINVYALGYAMMADIKRTCEAPDEEDKRLFPAICNTDWRHTIKEIVKNYRDESFVLQFLSPKVVKQLRLFNISMDAAETEYSVLHTHDDSYLHQIRHALSEQYDLAKRLPNIEITGVNWTGDRRLYLKHYKSHGVGLDFKETQTTVEYLSFLWGPVTLEEID